MLSQEVVKDVINISLSGHKAKENQRWLGRIETGDLVAASILFRVKNVILVNLSMNLYV